LNYFKYIFSDANARTHWIIYYSTIGLLSFVGYIVLLFGNQLNEVSVFGLTINLIIIFAFPLYYSYSYFNYRIQQRFLTNNTNIIRNDSIRNYEVELQQESFSVTTLIKNYTVKINPKVLIDKYTICKLDKTIVLLGQVYDFNIFRQHIRPIIIALDKNPILEKVRWCIFPKEYDVHREEKDLVISFTKNLNGISKLTIKNWEG